MSRFSQPKTVQISEQVKTLKLKTATLKRLSNEMVSYLKELKDNQEKLATMRANKAEELPIRKQEEFVDESTQVLQATRQNFMAALEGLQTFLNMHENDEDIAGTPELKTAEEILEKAEEVSQRR